jgi:hypothetical protein
MMKPVCVPCQRFYRPKKNGTNFIENMPAMTGALPGTQEPEKWVPYKLWTGDLWECEGCGTQIIVGVPSVPISEHYMGNFRAEVTSAELRMGKALDVVNDC